MAVDTKWGIVYCPKTGISNKRKRWKKIQKVLDERGVDYDFVQSAMCSTRPSVTFVKS